MRKIVIGGAVAALAMGLTGCNINANDNPTAAAPSSPASSAPAPAPSQSAASTPTQSSTPGNGSGSGDTNPSPTQSTPSSQGGGNQQIPAKWGPLHYIAPGKYAVGHVIFFTSTDTRLTIAGGDCPDGTPPPADSFKCGIDGLDEWAQNGMHDVNVKFSGQVATSIVETQ
ncbi:hypothetical protein J4573_45800 [Actinomadura barringtoniae]|uniref:Uncharacterized protein n=1 Tax=Actinomadura barringtoniae TaxID=1427535 RepID=A0A939PTG7_9ACTN|nr:hypothetical protein [Actinomadura barringtoniae]MBO2454471.1 hypothetical protein [Actinomadura barringtoniae]